MMEYLFSYGTLQEGDVQLGLFGRLLVGAKDRLKGYKAISIEISDESFDVENGKEYLIAVISNDDEDTIDGTAFEVTNEELLVADSYEPEEYKRISVTLESGKHSWIYVAA